MGTNDGGDGGTEQGGWECGCVRVRYCGCVYCVRVGYCGVCIV